MYLILVYKNCNRLIYVYIETMNIAVICMFLQNVYPDNLFLHFYFTIFYFHILNSKLIRKTRIKQRNKNIKDKIEKQY